MSGVGNCEMFVIQSGSVPIVKVLLLVCFPFNGQALVFEQGHRIAGLEALSKEGNERLSSEIKQLMDVVSVISFQKRYLSRFWISKHKPRYLTDAMYMDSRCRRVRRRFQLNDLVTALLEDPIKQMKRPLPQLLRCHDAVVTKHVKLKRNLTSRQRAIRICSRTC